MTAPVAEPSHRRFPQASRQARQRLKGLQVWAKKGSHTAGEASNGRPTAPLSDGPLDALGGLRICGFRPMLRPWTTHLCLTGAHSPGLAAG